MEFDISRVYTAINADELRAGDIVIVADNLHSLKIKVTEHSEVTIRTLEKIRPDRYVHRFHTIYGDFILAYLVERKENCLKCEHIDCPNWSCSEKSNVKIPCERYLSRATEKHYRPFKDTDELIKVWREKSKQVHSDYSLTMPYIWVKYKYDKNNKGSLITDFSDDQVALGDKDEDYMTMYDLFINFTFLDGSVCGVEE